MPLFGHRDNEPEPVAGGWQPAGAQPFDHDVVGDIHEITRALYGVPRRGPTGDVTVGETRFTEAFRCGVDGRTVTMANARTYIEPVLLNLVDHSGGAAVCVVELPSILAIACVQPRRVTPVIPRRWQVPTGDPVFDERFTVATMDGLPGGAAEVLTPQVRHRIMARDDWVFRFEGYHLICASKGVFRSFDQAAQRVSAVLGVMAAIPESVLPRRVDRSTDDLISTIDKLETLEDGIAFLQGLTPADRERLARSDTPLAAFADVQTPEQAIARFQSLDQRRRLQLIAMFNRVQDEQG